MDIPIDISNTILKTERLVLRPWQETDLSDFYEYASVAGVGEMAGWPHHETLEVSRHILKSFIEEKNVFALVCKENNKAIGSLGLHVSWANNDEAFAHLKVKEIGYVLSKDYWGKGYMPEAVREVIRFCFDQCGLDAITIGHFVSYNQSRRVIEKCGFTFFKNGSFYSRQLNKTFEDFKYILYR